MIAKIVSTNNKLGRALLLTLWTTLPLLFTPWTYEIFELPKISFLYVVTGAILFTIVLEIIYRKRIPFSPLHKPFLLIWLVYLFSTIFSMEPYTAVTGYYSRFHGGLLSITAYLVASVGFLFFIKKNQITKLLHLAILTGVLVSLYAGLQRLGLDAHYWTQSSQVRVFSTLGQPNWLADYLNVLLPLSLAAALTTKSKSSSWGYLLLTLLFGLTIIWTKSVTGLLVAVSTTTIILTSRFSTKQRLILLGIGALICFGAFQDPYIQSRIAETFPIRQIVWKGAWDTFASAPSKEKLLGYGPGNFAYAFLPHRPAELNLTTEWDFLFNKPHQEFLDILVNLGLLGLGAYLFTIYRVGKIFWNSFQNKRDLMNLGLFASWLSIIGTSSTGFMTVTTGFLFFSLPTILIIYNHAHIPAKAINEATRAFFTTLSIILAVVLLYWGISSFKADYYYAQGKRLYQTGQRSEAQESNLKAIKLNPYEPRYLRDQAFYKTEEALLTKNLITAEEAAQWQEKALLRNSKNSLTLRSGIFNYLALTDLENKYLILARDLTTQAIQHIPTDARLHLLSAQIHLKEGQEKEALREIDRALQLKPDFPEAEQMKRTLSD